MRNQCGTRGRGCLGSEIRADVHDVCALNNNEFIVCTQIDDHSQYSGIFACNVNNMCWKFVQK